MARTLPARAEGLRRSAAWLLAALALVGCGEDEPPTAAPAARPADAAPVAPEAGGPRDVDPAHVGGLSGRVTLAGKAPAPALLPVTGDAYCLGVAGAAGGLPDESLVVNDGGVGYAFVRVVAGLDDWRFPDPEGVVEIDQRGCLYHPRMVGVRKGQTLRLLNNDGILHNVHTKPARNREQNIAMTGDMLSRDLQFKRDEPVFEVACDVHAWMKGWIGVVDHPGFAVTAADGRWRIAGLPPGEYELEVWHERLGTRRTTVSVSEGETTAVTGLTY